MQIAPYGSWKSPISTDLIVAETIGLGSLALRAGRLYWLESRPGEGGRNCLVERDRDGSVREINPAPFNIRTRVHEYGGGAYLVTKDQVCYSNYDDQRLYTQQTTGDLSSPLALTSGPSQRFADGLADPVRNRLIAVCEDHVEGDGEGEPENSIVSVDLESGEVTTLVSGSDFYSSPCLSPDGSKLAWLSWEHPNMPWDSTSLFCGDIDDGGTVVNPRQVGGNNEHALIQPRWSPDGTLFFISDESGWWNLYRMGASSGESSGDSSGDSSTGCVFASDAEFGTPPWVFGMSSYGFRSAHELICTYSDRGSSHLASIDLRTGTVTDIANPFTSHESIQVDENNVYFIGASPTVFSCIVKLDLASGEHEIIKRSSSLQLDSGYYSIPEAVEYPTARGLTAHAFYYAPRNRDFSAPAEEKPPLLVKVHGGPTSATGSDLSLQIQYWTSRGFGVLDVNYGGSTGFGTAYRKRLNGNWGIVDMEDTENGARYLAQRGDVDVERLAIRGGSAGGYTTLAVLTFGNLFKAGASYYGVSDLEALAKDTHKFESRYLDSMVGAYPEEKQLYERRSPIHHVEHLSCPIIFFQGAEDRVVPPAQAEVMVDALRAKGLPVAYLLFEGEQHGFRKSENIKRALDAEFYFYSRMFGFEIADDIEPVQIDNL